eukprot:gene54440-74585_t
MGLRLGFPLTTNASMGLRYTLRTDDVVVDDSYCIVGQEVVSPALCAQRGSNVTSLIGYTVRLDRRNDLLKPTRGYFIELNQDLAGLGGDVNYLKTEASGGCHICEVEIDPETGVTTVVNFTAVDDVGRVVNPMIVEGQVQGGVAQGIGQALLES